MGPVFFVMAILGCGDGQAACRQVREVETHFASVDACTAAMPDALMAQDDLSYPETMAECRPGKATLAVAGGRPKG